MYSVLNHIWTWPNHLNRLLLKTTNLTMLLCFRTLFVNITYNLFILALSTTCYEQLPTSFYLQLSWAMFQWGASQGLWCPFLTFYFFLTFNLSKIVLASPKLVLSWFSQLLSFEITLPIYHNFNRFYRLYLSTSRPSFMLVKFSFLKIPIFVNFVFM